MTAVEAHGHPCGNFWSPTPADRCIPCWFRRAETCDRAALPVVLAALVGAVRAEGRSRVTVEQLRELKVFSDPERPTRFWFLNEQQVQAVHRLITGETP